MKFGSKTPWIERLAEAIGALALGGAMAWSAWMLAPWGLAAALALGAAGAAGGWLLLARIGGTPGLPLAWFEPAGITAPPGLSELLLDEIFGEPGELLLVDAIGAADPDGRVVQLFAPDALPQPGQLAAQIDDFLGSPVARRQAAAELDARAALHAALADIRASLRA